MVLFLYKYNYIPNFFLILHSILKLVFELHSSLPQFLCCILHVANFLLCCCLSNINMTLPFSPLLSAPRVHSAPQEWRGSDEAVLFGCVCQCVCSMEVTLSNRIMQYFSLQVTDRQGIAHVFLLRDWYMSYWKQCKGFKWYDLGGL